MKQSISSPEEIHLSPLAIEWLFQSRPILGLAGARGRDGLVIRVVRG